MSCRSSTGGRRRSRPTAAMCRRRRCRCMVEGNAIGVLAFHFTAPVNFDTDYQALLVSVAQHCAQALDRARLYESSQQARAEAENANRLEGRVRLHRVTRAAHAAQRDGRLDRRCCRTASLDATTSARALQSIHDNATRQAKLIEELLDFSRLKSGRMTLDMDEIDLRELLRGIVESIIPSVAAKGLELEMPPVPALRVHGDPRRLEQVFFNLLGNALKFTPRRRTHHRRRASGGPLGRDSRQRYRRRDRSGVSAARLRSLPPGRQRTPPGRTAASGLACRSPRSSSKRTTAGSPPRAPAPAADRPSSSRCRSPRPLKRRCAMSNPRLVHPRGRSSISERICSPTASQA